MNPITIAAVLLCLGILFLRFRNQAAKRGTKRKKFRTAKVLLSALLALMAIGFAVQRLNRSFDGGDPEPSLIERLVAHLSK
jgi:hypothetical protein